MKQETASSATVRDNAEERRYELPIDAKHAAFVEYRLMDDVIIFTHAETPPQFEGRGYGSMLAKGALEAARTRGLKVILEELMLDVMYRVPSEEEIEECVITKDVVQRRAAPILSLRKVG